MTKSIIELAREAGIDFEPAFGTCYTGNKQIERFATLHRAAIIAELCAGVEMPEHIATFPSEKFVWGVIEMRQRQNGLTESVALNAAMNQVADDVMKGTWVMPLDQMREAIASAVVKEREQCAELCKRIYFENYPDAEDFETGEEYQAIRARSDKV